MGEHGLKKVPNHSLGDLAKLLAAIMLREDSATEQEASIDRLGLVHKLDHVIRTNQGQLTTGLDRHKDNISGSQGIGSQK